MLLLEILGWVVAYLAVGAIYGCTCRTMDWPSLWPEDRSKIDSTGSMGSIMVFWPVAIVINIFLLLMVIVIGAFSYIPDSVIWLCDNSKYWVNAWRRKRKQQ